LKVRGTALAIVAICSICSAAAKAQNRSNNGDFSLLMLFVSNKERFLREWLQPTPPQLSTTNKTIRNVPIFMNLILAGCAADPSGNCNVTADVTIIDPIGNKYSEYKDMKIFSGKASGSVLMALSPAALAMRVEDGERLGPYRFVVTATDKVTDTQVTVEDAVTVSESN
jgi:hypothetical protein